MASLTLAAVGVGATTVVARLVVLVFGEIVPKAFSLGNAGPWSLTVTPVIAVPTARSKSRTWSE